MRTEDMSDAQLEGMMKNNVNENEIAEECILQTEIYEGKEWTNEKSNWRENDSHDLRKHKQHTQDNRTNQKISPHKKNNTQIQDNQY